MNEEKYESILKFHEESLRRKENLVKPLHEKRHKAFVSNENLSNQEYCSMLVLEAEIQQEKEFIEDLKYIMEE
jgi:hypothetical protein